MTRLSGPPVCENKPYIEMTEKEFTHLVVEAAHWFGYECYHTFFSIHSRRGYPDLTLWKPGRLIYAELKTTKGKVSPYQQECLDGLKATGKCEVYVWKPENWKEIERLLNNQP